MGLKILKVIVVSPSFPVLTNFLMFSYCIGFRFIILEKKSRLFLKIKKKISGASIFFGFINVIENNKKK